MKVTSIVAVLVASALASVHATGLTGATCEYGTPAPTTLSPTPAPTTVAPTPDPTTPGPTPDPTTPGPTPEPTSVLPTPGPTTTGPTPGPTTVAPTVTPTPDPTAVTPIPDPTTVTPTPDPTTVTPTPDPTTVTPSPTPEPTTTAPPAVPVDCELFTALTDPSPWGPCTDDGNGVFYRSKLLSIKTPAANSGTECVSETDPTRTAKDMCATVNCVPLTPEEDQGAYGDCKKDDATGTYRKTKVLGIKTPAQNGGTCLVTDRLFSVPCQAIDCVPYTAEEDTGAFGECVDDGTGKFFKSKILGIKTPAQFGGTDCVPPKDRTYAVLCDAVACVPVSLDDDTGAFGPCVSDNTGTVYYKSKVLGIKTPAKNGGSCLETDRTIKEVCSAIDCEAYTPEEDKGAFGDCQVDGAGKFFKSKVLGIKTSAQYGGVECPSEAKRTYSEPCLPIKCVPFTPEEDTSTFGECKDNGAGVFYKARVLGIKVPAQNGGTCLVDERTIKELCVAIDCVAFTVANDPGQFGECLDDGSGTYYKSKVLGIQTPAQNGGIECETDATRSVKELCTPVNCIPLNVADDQGEYGACQLDPIISKYVKSKVLGIKTQAKYGGTCLEKDRIVSSPCEGIDCVVNSPDEDTGMFGPCEKEATSNTYYKAKVLGIKMPAQFGGLCPSPAERTHKEVCPPINCVPVEPQQDTGAFGACQKDDATGTYVKSKVVDVKTPAQNGGTCLESDRTVSLVCAAVNCVVYTPIEDPSSFGACQDDGSGKYYKTKILGIKVPAQYGGTECAPLAQRKYSEFCPPINCVPLSPQDDKGDFWPCRDDGTGKFYQYRVLGIKVPAQNGGTCLEKDRTVSQFCPPVQCVVYAAKDDPGPFGPCSKDAVGPFYSKAKTLGIKTAALYGGSCPLPTDPSRSYKERCPPVDCVVTKEADDTQAYSTSCTRFPDNQYYRTKILPIIAQPVYGGKACPLEADRTLKQLCPNDGYCLPSDPFYNQCVPKLAQCGDKINDKVYDGFELELVKGVQLWECCDKCTATAGCVAYSFTAMSNAAKNECSLKWKAGSMIRKNGAISSAPKVPKSTACSFYDNGYNTLPLANLKEVQTASLAECCDNCVKLPKCVTFNLKNNNCELKEKSWANIVNYVFAADWRSGSVN